MIFPDNVLNVDTYILTDIYEIWVLLNKKESNNGPSETDRLLA